MNYRSLMCWAGAIGILAGCSSARDVEVSGDVSDPDGLAQSDPVTVAFYERDEPAGEEETTEGELAFVHTVSLEAAGSFDEVVPVSGEKLYAIAFIDSDGNEACTDGEPWGDTEVTIGEDDTATVSIRVRSAATCPAGLDTEE